MKRRLALLRRTDREARLATAQLLVARDYGFLSWRALRAHVQAARVHGELPKPWMVELAETVAAAVGRGDVDAAVELPGAVALPGVASWALLSNGTLIGRAEQGAIHPQYLFPVIGTVRPIVMAAAGFATPAPCPQGFAD